MWMIILASVLGLCYMSEKYVDSHFNSPVRDPEGIL